MSEQLIEALAAPIALDSPMSPIDRSMMMVEIGSSIGNAARPMPPPTAPDEHCCAMRWK